MVKLLGGSSDVNQVVSDMNTNLLEILGEQTTKIIKDDTGTRRILLGKGADGFYGLKVSREGADVYTASGDDLVFNSDQNVFKIVERNTGLIPAFSIAAGGASLLTVPHNQSTTPIVQVYVEATLLNWNTSWAIASSYIPAPLLQDSGAATTGYLFPAANGNYYPVTITFSVDDTNLYVQAVYTAAVATIINEIEVTYFIMQESAV